MICPRLELLEGPMAVGAVSGSAGRSCVAVVSSSRREPVAGSSGRKDASVQRLAGGVQFCTQKDIKTREGTCECGSIVETMATYPGIPRSQGEARDVKLRARRTLCRKQKRSRRAGGWVRLGLGLGLGSGSGSGLGWRWRWREMRSSKLMLEEKKGRGPPG